VKFELHELPSWKQSAGEELANSISHGIGFVAALIGTPILLLAAFQHGGTGFFLGTIVFTSTMVLLYLGSTLYHAWPPTRGKSVLQVFDHSAIFLLIAGTYTPIALGPLHGPWGFAILAAIWALAIFGVILKTARGTSRHRKLSLCLYLGMGWLGVVAVRPALQLVPQLTLAWLVTGGIAYTLGVVFFVNEHRSYNHFIWHLFVLTGTGCHFAAVLTCAV
jgi:hemolysin III